MTNDERRDLDLWIAIHFMGWEWVGECHLKGTPDWVRDPESGGLRHAATAIPFYSADPLACFALLEKLIADGYTLYIAGDKESWIAELIGRKFDWAQEDFCDHYKSEAPTLPEALALGAKSAYSKPEAENV